MDIKEQVLSREQMVRLQELGVDTSDASMCWAGDDVVPNNGLAVDLGHDGVPTYTIGDLIVKIPKKVGDYNLKMDFQVFEVENPALLQSLDSKCRKLADDLYKLLCWVAENHKELIR